MNYLLTSHFYILQYKPAKESILCKGNDSLWKIIHMNLYWGLSKYTLKCQSLHEYYYIITTRMKGIQWYENELSSKQYSKVIVKTQFSKYSKLWGKNFIIVCVCVCVLHVIALKVAQPILNPGGLILNWPGPLYN